MLCILICVVTAFILFLMILPYKFAFKEVYLFLGVLGVECRSGTQWNKVQGKQCLSKSSLLLNPAPRLQWAHTLMHICVHNVVVRQTTE